MFEGEKKAMSTEDMQQLCEQLHPKMEEMLSNLGEVLRECGIPREAVKIEFTLDVTKLQSEYQRFSLVFDGQKVPLSTENQKFLLGRCECVPCHLPGGLCCWKCT